VDDLRQFLLNTAATSTTAGAVKNEQQEKPAGEDTNITAEPDCCELVR